MKYYSQFDQDKWLHQNIFPNKTKGYFVDIGAYDGVHCSNTKFFEDQGWSGVCVEPLPRVFKTLQKNRTCLCKQGVISHFKENEVEFCDIDGYCEMLSGVVANYSEEHKRRIVSEEHINGGSTRSKIKVKNLTFSDITNNTEIDLLDIDTEGGELDILKNIDFNKYKTFCILVENNYNDGSLNSFLASKNFRLKHSLVCDQVYINNKG